MIPVSDLEKAVAVYCRAFELQEVFRSEQIIFVGRPEGETPIGLLLDSARAGAGPQNVGVHVDHAVDYEAAVRDIETAGGRIIERGEHAPGVPFARIADPDGNELWL